jgi:cell division protein FtsB
MGRRRSAATRRREDLWTRALLLLCLAWAGVNLARFAVQEARLLRQHKILADEQRLVDAKRSSLKAQVAEARSYRGAEYVARKTLVMARPDEIPVLFTKGATGRIVALREQPQPNSVPQSR